MPVAAGFAAIGSALGASAATATAVGVAAVGTTASIGLQAYGMVQQNKANKAAAKVAQETAQYNASVDQNAARQIELDAEANAKNAHQEAQVYLSRQRAAFAASGVLAEGSPLAAEATTAGRIEQRIQQDRSNALREAMQRDSSAQATLRYGAATTEALRRQNEIDMLRGGVGILDTVSKAYDSGVFANLPNFKGKGA